MHPSPVPVREIYRAVLRGGDVVLDKARHQVRAKGREIELRQKKFALLEILFGTKAA